jgi:pimeloyl-ACP methyl ester carboxylesterase
VFLNGVTARGRRHPEVQRLARGFARAGYFVVVPDLPGLRSGTLTFRTYEGAVDVTLATEYRTRGDVTLAGVSVGASLALVAAEDPRVAARVRVVLGVAPYASVAQVARLATTSTYRAGRRIVPYRPDSFVGLVIGRSLAAALPPGADRTRLLGVLRSRHKRDRRPLRDLPPMRSRGGGALRRLLSNRDPRRFDALWARLPVSVRRAPFLSPLAHVRRLRAPVYLATAPHDKYFPPAESRALAARSVKVHVTVTRTLAHAVPHFSGGDVADLFRFVAFLVRGLHAAR